MAYPKDVMDYLLEAGRGDLASKVARLVYQRAELLEALKEANDALEHMWREVSMNEYNHEKLNEAIINSDSAITKAEAVE